MRTAIGMVAIRILREFYTTGIMTFWDFYDKVGAVKKKRTRNSVDIIDVMKLIYNFKASDWDPDPARCWNRRMKWLWISRPSTWWQRDRTLWDWERQQDCLWRICRIFSDLQLLRPSTSGRRVQQCRQSITWLCWQWCFAWRWMTSL